MRRLAWMAAITALAGLVRWPLVPATNGDMRDFVIPWLQTVGSQGFAAFGQPFYDYSPAYIYVLWAAAAAGLRDIVAAAPSLATVADLAAIKTISFGFDIVGAWFASRLAAHDRASEPLAFASVLLAPTVVMNSGLWGQADMAYSCWLLATVLFMARGRHAAALACYSLGFAVKLQAIFLLPYVAGMLWRDRADMRLLLLPVAAYVVSLVPAWFAGRPLLDLLLIYPRLAGRSGTWALNAPSLFIFLSKNPDAPAWFQALKGLRDAVAQVMGTLGTLGSSWMSASISAQADADPWRRLRARDHLLLATLCVFAGPYLMPRMHERYFFPADLLSLPLGVLNPSLWYAPVVLQVTSGLAYVTSLYGDSPLIMRMSGFNLTLMACAVINGVLLVALVRAAVARFHPRPGWRPTLAEIIASIVSGRRGPQTSPSSIR